MIFLPSATKLRRLCFYRRVFVHMGGCLPQCILGYHPPTPQNQTPPQGADTPQEQTPPQEADPRADIPQEADTPQEADPPTRCRPPHQEADPPPRYCHCCRRYASYWNVFLFYFILA